MQYTPGVLQTIYHIYRFATQLLPDNYDICSVYRKSTANLQLSTASYSIYTVYSVYRDFQSLLMDLGDMIEELTEDKPTQEAKKTAREKAIIILVPVILYASHMARIIYGICLDLTL